MKYDLIVIGGGPGGYVCAIRAAQLGLKTACVEFRGALGGTCLNVGCIPSKALLESSHLVEKIKHESEQHGINAKIDSVDIPAMMKRKEKVVSSMTKGIEGLFKKNKVDYLNGFGSIVSGNKVAVKDSDGNINQYETENIVIATGSEPIELKMAPFDEKSIVSSTGALAFDKVPKSLAVVGGGVIGLELGSVWARLGSEVTVIEAADNILGVMDKDLVKEATKLFKKQGLKIHVKTALENTEKTKKGIRLTCKKDGESIDFETEKALICVGRRPFTENLGLDKVGVKQNQRGFIEIDDHYRTSVANIYAIGDVVPGPMLAHKAEDEGVAVAEIIKTGAGHVNYRAIPSVVYTWPEIASVGESEQDLKAKGVEYKVGKFPFAANGRAKAAGERDGFVKIIADKRTDLVLGFHIIGPNASEMIAEAVIGIEYDASAEDFARSVHAHPTLAEAMREAAFDVDKRAIHF